MVKEVDSLVPTRHATQLVLVGDQQQLGPTYEYKFKGEQSLFSRLIKIGYKTCFLSYQYRMHDSLLIVPNTSFYGDRIESQYLRPKDKIFLYLDSPFIFIDVSNNGREQLDGTSFKNLSEVAAIKQFIEFWLNLVKDNKGESPLNFKLSDIAIITPYKA